MKLIKMKQKIFCSLLLGLLCSAVSFAQEVVQISGKVTDAESVALPGVGVMVVGTQNGTATDFDGMYTLQANKGDVLEFSYLGYSTQQVTIGDATTIDVTLQEDAESLADVIVVGYGTQKKSHLTGAIAKVGGDDVAAVQAQRVDDALAGKLSGVLIQNQTGEPGADPKIQIRAASSVSGASNPLVVVDGYPISGSIATVNPNDIQSIEILKDAASAAIYGSRGANGVILVTTKKGKSGKAKFSYNTYLSTTSRYKKDNINPTASEYGTWIENSIADGTIDVSEYVASVGQDVLDYRINMYKNSPDVQAVEDWLFQSGTSMSHDFSVSGGSDNSNFFASVGYQDNEGAVITQGFERVNARLNVDTKLGDKFKAGLSFNGFTSKRDILAHDMRDLIRAYSVHPIYHTEESIAFVQEQDQIAQSLGLSSFDSGYRGSGNFNSSIYTLEVGDTAQDWHYGRSGNGIGGSGDAGPATKLDNVDQWEKTFYGNLSAYLQYQIIDDLNIKTVLGGDINNTESYYYKGLEFDSRERSDQTALDEATRKNSSILTETTLNYAKEIGKHEISGVLGFEIQNNFVDGISTNATNLVASDIINYDLIDPSNIVVSETETTIVRNSIFGRINYAYDDRYLFSGSLRRDGDSRFGENNRYKTFPALSLGWNIHNESFFEDLPDEISNFKLRFSTGSLGTTSFLGAYDSLSLLNASNTALGTGYLIPDNVANPDLTWQSNTETNYGTDLGFLNNRIRIGFDYYTSDIEDMLIEQSTTEIIGASSQIRNVGDVRSSGLELELSAAIINKKDLTWDVSANFSTVNTEITDLGELDQLPDDIAGQSGRGPVFRNYVGGQIGEMWGLQTAGEVAMSELSNPVEYVGQQSGWSYVVDQNGDGVIDATRTVEEGGDLVKIGQNTPDFYWGLNTSVKYKDFDLAMQFQGSHGGEVYNIDPLYYGSQWGRGLQADFDADDDGIADANGLHYARNRDQTDAQVQDASFVALRNLTLGYTLQSSLTSKVGLSSARLYLAATNLLYFWSDDYTSYNPEGVETTGGDYQGPITYGYQVGASPVVRSFTVGLNVNF